MTRSTNIYGNCGWQGDSPWCSGSPESSAPCHPAIPEFVVAARAGFGGEQKRGTGTFVHTCYDVLLILILGAKRFCCRTPIPDEFTNCAWYTKETQYLPEDICEPSCSSGYIKLATQQGSCRKGEAAYCCAGKSGELAKSAREMPSRNQTWEVGSVYLGTD